MIDDVIVPMGITVDTETEGVITFSKECSVSKAPYTLTVDIYKYYAWKDGALVQDAFPDLKPEQREFLISGITPSEWEAMFPSSEE